MPTYQQIMAANIETIKPQIDGWTKVAGTLGGAKKQATAVRKGIRDGDWKGESEKAADGKVDFLGEQVAAAKTEVDSIGWILWRAQRLFHDFKTQLQDLAEQINAHPYLKVDGNGVVSIDAEGTRSLVLSGPRNQGKASALSLEAGRLTAAIKKLVDLITTIDEDIAKALRAASHVDNPYDPNFNANAPKDGNIALEKYMNDKWKLNFHNPWGIPDDTPLIGGRTPQEMAAVLKNLEKYGSIEAYKKFAEEQGKKLGGELNGRGDAMRHTLMSAMLARDLGQSDARFLMDGHERLPNNTPGQEVMDRHNNDLGYRIGREHPNASNEELARLIKTEVESGHTLSVNNDTKRVEYTDGVPPQPRPKN